MMKMSNQVFEKPYPAAVAVIKGKKMSSEEVLARVKWYYLLKRGDIRVCAAELQHQDGRKEDIQMFSARSMRFLKEHEVLGWLL